ncbi:MAG TPA: TrmH family RNA methyltransferase [Thermoanaerobaculia bacterium]
MAFPTPVLVLVRPHLPSNLGSAARAAKNFGVSEIRLVEPAAAVDEDSHRLASGADDLLASLKRYADLDSAVAELPAVIATSSMRGRESQRFLDLAELPSFMQDLGRETGVGFVFGPERSGLTEAERSRASACLRLPSVPDFPTLNVSHAIAVVLAISRLSAPSSRREEPLASASEIEGAVSHWDRALDAIGFYDTGHRERSLRDWRRIVAGRPLTEKECALLRGVANRVMVALRLKSEP